MPIRRFSFALFFLAIAIAATAADRPNIVFLFADDLGYGDVGAFGQTKIRTPNIDRIAKDGMRLTQCYAGNAVCAPSRCVLMTGMHPGHAQVRNNHEVKPEGQHPLKADTVTLPRLLHQLGYVTGGFGKWGLGGPDSDGRPTKQGIDRWFGYNCQRVAHSHYPAYLWDNDTKFVLSKNPQNPPLTGHEKLPEGADPNDDKSYAGLAGAQYGMDVITEQAVKFVNYNKGRPFFLYYPTIIPHAAFQVPEDSLAEYQGKFPEEKPYLANYTANRTPRATFAAMVTRMDRHIGQIIAAIRENGLFDNTIFVFTSDNGPVFDSLAGERIDFFNSTGGFRGRKGNLYEAGVHEPTIVAWKGHIAPGTTSNRVCGFEDWLPTLLELVGGKDSTPKDIDGISFAPTLLGQSQPPRPFLYREYSAGAGQQSIRLGDWKGIRPSLMPSAGKAKAKKAAADTTAGPDLHIELYNLKTDPHETTDVSKQHPDIIAQMEKLLREQHAPNPDFPLPGIDKS
jgi:arylsulfatase A-like enzyme